MADGRSRRGDTMLALALVFVGGAAGTAARAALNLLLEPSDGIPVAILTANLLGAFLIGVLTAVLGPGVRDDRLRLLLGAGLLGGFTTYSALAVDTVALLGADPARGVLYGLGSVVAGLLLAAAGLRVGVRLAARGRRVR